MDFEKYQTEDFACDHTFQQYCREENKASVTFWNNWINDHPEKQEEVHAARELVHVLSAGQGRRNIQLKQLQTGLQQRELLEQNLDTPDKPAARAIVRVMRYVSGIAACLLIAAGAYWFLKSPASSDIPAGAQNAHTFSSDMTERKTVILPDGTLVTLKKHSSLRLADDFGARSRELDLEGEGFFEVTHDASRPFIVHTGTVNVKVLGTVFNVSAYPDSKGITETSLFSGKVEVTLNGHSGKSYILGPDQKLTTSGKTNTDAEQFPVKIAAVNRSSDKSTPVEIAWLSSRLEISDEPLEDIAAKLAQWYGIRIEFEDNAVRSYRYSGTFKSETAVKALEALQLSYPFKFRTDHEKIIISK